MNRGYERAYTEYIQSDTWKEKAREIRAKAGYRCERCGKGGVVIEVHHKTYRNFGDEWDGDLEALCKECHEEADEERRIEVAERRFDAQLNGWGQKVYGEDWRFYPGYGIVKDEFECWLERKGY